MKKYLLLFVFFVFQCNNSVFSGNGVGDFGSRRFNREFTLEREFKIVVFCLSAWSDSMHNMFDSLLGTSFFDDGEQVIPPAHSR